MHFISKVFSNITSLMTSVCMQYVGAMATELYLSWYYADKLLKGENQSTSSIDPSTADCIYIRGRKAVYYESKKMNHSKLPK